MLNQIHDLFAHTLKCLTLGGKIVDCPHYERLGYGGDGNASTMTAQTLYDLYPLYTTWLTHWADCNGPDGDMPHTAPTYWSSGGGPYWCTFIIKAAWETYLNYGDKRILETFYPNMLSWLGYVQKYSPKVLLEEYPTTENRNWYLGDWATPEGIDQRDPRSVGLVTNCAIVDSYDKMIKIARVLNKIADMEDFIEKKNVLSNAIHSEFYNSELATYGTGVQIDMTYPLLLDIVPDSLKGKVTKTLYSRIFETDKGHLATGLVGLPIITQWVNTNETSGILYEMITKKDYPGFGFMLENGATTTWEHWRGERSRIHNCYNAPGSWFYQSIGGIQPLEEYPGYERFLLAPRPPNSVTWAKVSKETYFGTIKVEWKKEQNQIVMQVTIPTGSRAKLVLPNGVKTCVIDDETSKPDKEGTIWIPSGKYNIRYQQI
jgi:alpha-L-rhamnosidase